MMSTNKLFSTLALLVLSTLCFVLSPNTEINAQSTCSSSLGAGTSSSATRGPFQRSDSLSGSVYSRANMLYTQAEIVTTLGIASGETISEIQWDLGSTNVITASGNATLNIYMKNSSLANMVGDTWANHINGSTLVGTYTFNTTNNFPGVKGFISFPLATPFVYTGNSIEIGVEWDCSGLTSIHPNANRLFSGNGSLNWNWDNTAHNSLNYRSGSSSPPSDLAGGSLKSQRVNTIFCTMSSSGCSGSMTSDDLGIGTSSSATRGPFQRSDSLSGSVYSRANMLYTQAELVTTLGIAAGTPISQINWDLGSTNVITASGNATLNIYMKNSSLTNMAGDTWVNHINGSTLVGTYTFNTTNNFPGVKGFMPFPLATPFVYTGNSIEIGVEWDCSGLTSIHPNADRLLSGNGSLNWRWDNTAHTSLNYRSGSSSPPSDLAGGSLKSERVNTQFVTECPPTTCDAPANLSVTNVTATTADISWAAATNAISYNWIIVPTGAGPTGAIIDMGNTLNLNETATGLTTCTSYDLHVQSDCGSGNLSSFSAAYPFMTGSTVSAALGAGTSSSATRGPFQRSDTTSGSVYSRANMLYTQTELVTTLGIANGNTISEIQWDLGSTNVITASGNATLNIYMKNSSLANMVGDTWVNHINGSTLVGTYTFNTTNNFPGAKGFISFPLATPFVYTGNSIEIGVEWDCSGLTSIHPNANRLLSGNGSLNWHWDNTAHTSLNYRSGSSSPPSDLAGGSLKSERVNTQFVSSSCAPPPTNPCPCDGTGLTADVNMNTYDLITSVLGPGGNPIEVPDCGHAAFGDHITQVSDPVLGQDVFQFHLHVDEDDDRCINFDRQRNEIKTYSNSPPSLLGYLGDTVEYKWKFKLDAGFQPSAKFTHIHQLKSVGASNNEDSMPQVTFTLRKGSPDQFELRYAEDLSQITWAQTDLTPFKGNWVEVTEKVVYGDWGQGSYTVAITDVVSGSSLFTYTNGSTRMWKTNATFVRPKWGIYRSLEDKEDLRDETVCYANFCIDKIATAAACSQSIAFVNVTSITSSTADLIWGGVVGATNYTWTVVIAGGSPSGPVIATGTSPNTTATVAGLSPDTSYDLYIEADCGATNATGFNFTTTGLTTKIITDAIGTETGSSASRGPIQQGGANTSTTRFSRFLQVFTQAELAAIGLSATDSIKQLQWYITTNDVISSGSAPLNIYIKNSSATRATPVTWSALTGSSTLSLNTSLDLLNNFPGTSGWMPFTLGTPFVYTGDALEVAVEFDWSAAVFTNNGAVRWRYSNFPDSMVVRALGSTAFSSNLVYSTSSTLPTQRANMRICYEPVPPTCVAPSNLSVTNITSSSADLSWDPVNGTATTNAAIAYTWKLMEVSTGTVVDSGTGTETSVSVENLNCVTAYNLLVQADCGNGDLSEYSVAYSFVTSPAGPPTVLTIGTATSSSSSRGPIQQGGGTTTTRYSRFNQVFTQVELAAAGLTPNSSITELQWSLASTDVIAGVGNAPMKVYIKNSTATKATVVSWSSVITGATQVVDRVFNTTNNFPGVTGWMPFMLNAPFLYTGGALEIAVEWDFGSISAPAFTGSDASNPNGKSIKWHYSNFADTVVVRGLGSGSHATSNLSYASGSTLPTERANIQFVSVPVTACGMLDIQSGNELMFGDPCHCEDPRNCNVDGVTYFHDTLTVMTPGNISGLTITAAAGATDFYTSVPCFGGSLNVIPAGTIIPENPAGSGIYKIEFWRPSGIAPTLTVVESGVNIGVPPSTFLPICRQQDCVDIIPIPTMSEWGLLIFGLLIMNLSVFFVKRRELI